MAERLRVLVDLLAMLDSLHSGVEPAGVTRSVLGFIAALRRHPEVDVFFTVTSSPLAGVLLARDHGRIPFVTADRIVDAFDIRWRPFVLRVLGPRLSPKSQRWWPRTFARQLRSAVKRLSTRRAIPRAFDVYHSPFTPLAPAESCGARIRFLTVHDVIALRRPEFFPGSSRPFLQRIVDSVDRERDWIVANSEFTKSEFCAYTGMNPARVFVTPWAADRAVFRPVEDERERRAVRARYGIPDGPYVMSLATLEPRKNLAHLVRSFDELLSREPAIAASLVIAGSKGWIYDGILDAAARARRGDRIVFTGRVPDADLAALLSGARVFAYVSLCEGFGLPVLEAMQCGAPVVASSTSSLPEVAGDAGLLVDPADGAALVEALARVLSDHDLTRAMRAKGIARAATFSWDRCADETVAAYRAALDAAACATGGVTAV